MKLIKILRERKSVLLPLFLFIGVVLYVAYPRIVLFSEKQISAYTQSGDVAYAFSEVHFNSLHGRLYDLDAAEFFLKETLRLDKNNKEVRHQLARVAFLRGNYPSALAHINLQIDMFGDGVPNSYYVRGLIEGYMGLYDEAATDYEKYLEYNLHNWAALNDFAWVLLKGEHFEDAKAVAEFGVNNFPNNPWLLNSYAIALYELGEYDIAQEVITMAHDHLDSVSARDWLTAYPGNSPLLAKEGIQSLDTSIHENMHMIKAALSKSTVE